MDSGLCSRQCNGGIARNQIVQLADQNTFGFRGEIMLRPEDCKVGKKIVCIAQDLNCAPGQIRTIDSLRGHNVYDSDIINDCFNPRNGVAAFLKSKGDARYCNPKLWKLYKPFKLRITE